MLLARQINAALGGPFVSPADVDEMDETTIDELTSLVAELPGLQDGYARKERAMAEWRGRHPTYRKNRNG